MPNPQNAPSVSEIAMTSRVLRPNPRWFLVRAIPWVLLALFIYRSVARTGGLGLLLAIGGAVLWLVVKNSSIALHGDGFTYQFLGKRTSHRWVDVESFCVVEQRAFGLIPINRYLGWNFSPAYKNYKLLAIPRALARFVGMSDAMIKPLGFDVKELSAVMNQQLARARAVDTRKPAPIPS